MGEQKELVMIDSWALFVIWREPDTAAPDHYCKDSKRRHQQRSFPGYFSVIFGP